MVGDVGEGVDELKAMLETLDQPILRIGSAVDSMYKMMEGR